MQRLDNGLCLAAPLHADCVALPVRLVGGVVQAVGVVRVEGGVEHCWQAVVAVVVGVVQADGTRQTEALLW